MMNKIQECQYIEAVVNLNVYFGANYEKIRAFMHLKNMNLGGVSPIEMIMSSKQRGLRLIKWIENQLDENELIDWKEGK